MERRKYQDKYIVNRVLLDFGANRGQGLGTMLSMYDVNNDWIIESYEPTPDLFEKLQERVNRPDLNINFHQKAVWNKSESVKFSVMNEEDQGSSVDCLMSAGVCADQASKSYRHHDNIIAVDAIDIIDIINKYNDDDEIIIKMDIEGSEFIVLRRLLEDYRCCKRVKKIFIEWHDCYMKNESEETRNDIITRLSNLGIQLMNNWM